MAQIAEATGWLPHTVRGFFAGLKKRQGITVTASERVRQVGPDKAGTTGSYSVHRIADAGLPALADRLASPDAPRRVSLLLSGPPGCGKRAFARHLAERMGLPVLVRRASDLLGMYVGQTEQQIARAFAEAREEGAMLVFDEADSLLAERGLAQRSWEVSQVNEMLTWMERHPLPFCCTTNLPDRLDGAAMRRFLVKARFGYLTPAQCAVAWCRAFASEPPAGLAALNRLTPADFD